MDRRRPHGDPPTYVRNRPQDRDGQGVSDANDDAPFDPGYH